MTKSTTKNSKNNSNNINRSGLSILPKPQNGTVELPVYNITYNPDWDVSLSNGNIKVGKGVYTWSTLPGDEEPIDTSTRGILTNIKGTCSGVCEVCKNHGCYAMRDAKLHHNVTIFAWAKNTLLMRNNREETFEKLYNFLVDHKATVLRINVSGEMEVYEELPKWCELAKRLPNVIFYFYTKRFDYIAKYLKEEGDLPENLGCNISKWHDNINGYNFEDTKVNIFAYDDGDDPSIDGWTYCPAVDAKGHETGITCAQCKRCFKNKGLKTRVHAH